MTILETFLIERGVIGSLLIMPNQIDLAIENSLLPKHFNNIEFRKIYTEMLRQVKDIGKIEPFTLGIEEERMFEITEGLTMADFVIGSKKLIDIYEISSLNERIPKILDSKTNSKEMKEKIQNVLEDSTRNHDENKDYATKDLAERWLDSQSKKERNGTNLPYARANEYFFFQSGSLITIGARPAMGKTAFALNLALRTAFKEKVLFVSIEMDNEELTDRIVSSLSRVPLEKVRDKTMNELEKGQAFKALNVLRDMKLTMLDCDNNNFLTIIQNIRRLHKIHKFKVIFIDYLTLMSASGLANKNLEVEYMANKLKLLAKELKTCIVTLAQLNRDIDKDKKVKKETKERKPILSDLRDSGGIEQASNVVCMLHREDYYTDPEQNGKLSALELLIRKNRSGRLGTIKMVFDKETQNIVEDKNQEVY